MLLEVVELVEVVEVLFGFYVKISPVMRQHFFCIVGVGWGQLCCDDWHLRQQQLLSRLSLITSHSYFSLLSSLPVSGLEVEVEREE